MPIILPTTFLLPQNRKSLPDRGRSDHRSSIRKPWRLLRRSRGTRTCHGDTPLRIRRWHVQFQVNNRRCCNQPKKSEDRGLTHSFSSEPEAQEVRVAERAGRRSPKSTIMSRSSGCWRITWMLYDYRTSMRECGTPLTHRHFLPSVRACPLRILRGRLVSR